jgi:hypothetical protein
MGVAETEVLALEVVEVPAVPAVVGTKADLCVLCSGFRDKKLFSMVIASSSVTIHLHALPSAREPSLYTKILQDLHDGHAKVESSIYLKKLNSENFIYEFDY